MFNQHRMHAGESRPCGTTCHTALLMHSTTQLQVTVKACNPFKPMQMHHADRPHARCQPGLSRYDTHAGLICSSVQGYPVGSVRGCSAAHDGDDAGGGGPLRPPRSRSPSTSVTNHFACSHRTVAVSLTSRQYSRMRVGDCGLLAL